MKTNKTEGFFEWLVLTETASSILNELIAYTGREEIKELAKPVPDADRLLRLEMLFRDIWAVNHESLNFKSIGRMQNIISNYAPMLRTVNEGGQVII